MTIWEYKGQEEEIEHERNTFIEQLKGVRAGRRARSTQKMADE